MKRTHNSFLLLLLGALMLTACGGKDGEAMDTETASAPTDSAEAVTENPYNDSLPAKMDLEGYEFRVLIFDKGNIEGHNNAWRGWIDIDAETGETMNDAAYRRNLEVEERLNVHISCLEQGNFGETVPIVRKAVMAGDDAFDFVILQNDRTATSSLLTDNCLLDLNGIEALDLSQPYYLQSVQETFNLSGKQYLLSGDALCSLYSHSYIFTNMDLWGQYDLEDPYELVRSGAWTLDKCFSLIKGTYKDLNGNSKADNDDFYGITGLNETLGYCFHSGGGMLYHADDNSYSFPVTVERNINILERLVAESQNPDCYFKFSDSTSYIKPYNEGRAIMHFSGSSITWLRDVDFYAGLLPFPKFDEAQEQYYSILAGALGGIPTTVSDPERTGTILEAFFSASSRHLKPAFIQTYVEQKVLQDEGSQEMFALIMDTGRHNFVDYVDPSGKFNGYKLIYDQISKKSTDLSSKWETIRKTVETSFADFFAEME